MQLKRPQHGAAAGLWRCLLTRTPKGTMATTFVIISLAMRVMEHKTNAWWYALCIILYVHLHCMQDCVRLRSFLCMVETSIAKPCIEMGFLDHTLSLNFIYVRDSILLI